MTKAPRVRGLLCTRDEVVAEIPKCRDASRYGVPTRRDASPPPNYYQGMLRGPDLHGRLKVMSLARYFSSTPQVEYTWFDNKAQLRCSFLALSKKIRYSYLETLG